MHGRQPCFGFLLIEALMSCGEAAWFLFVCMVVLKISVQYSLVWPDGCHLRNMFCVYVIEFGWVRRLVMLWSW